MLISSQISAGRHAFSLIELAVVIVILGIIAVVAVERAIIHSETRARMAANELALNLRYVRNMAVNQERTVKVSFDPGSNSYSVDIHGPTAPDGFAPMPNPIGQSDWAVCIADRFSGVVLESVDIDGGNILFFDATNGVPLSAGGSELTNSGTISFNAGVAVTVAPETGYVEISQ